MAMALAMLRPEPDKRGRGNKGGALETFDLSRRRLGQARGAHGHRRLNFFLNLSGSGATRPHRDLTSPSTEGPASSGGAFAFAGNEKPGTSGRAIRK